MKLKEDQRIRYLFRKNKTITEISEIMGVKRRIVDACINKYIASANWIGGEIRGFTTVQVIFGKTTALHAHEDDYGTPVWNEVNYFDLSHQEKRIANLPPVQPLISNQYDTIKP